MSNKYEKLIKLYYKKKNIDEEYIKKYGEMPESSKVKKASN